jgi:RNA polymerase sigma factor (TIGR02999 family)
MDLTPSIVRELERRARGLVRRGARAPVDAESLVQEAVVRLLGARDHLPETRDELLAYAARVLRTTLVDQAERRGAQKRGGQAVRHELDAVEFDPLEGPDLDTVLDVHASLERLERIDADLARIVELRYFGGYSCREVAEARGVEPGEVEERSRLARRWLRADLGCATEDE